MGKEKWATLIKYLDSTNAKPESVLNLVKQSFGVKNKPKTDDYNQMRRAWTLFVVHGIYNKSGVPEKEKKAVKISNQISYFVESKAYQMTYDLMHPVTIYNEKLKIKDNELGITKWNIIINKFKEEYDNNNDINVYNINNKISFQPL